MKKYMITISVIVIAVGIFLQVSDKPEDTESGAIVITADPFETALLEYMDAVAEKDYQKMYELISEQSKVRIKQDDFVERNQNIYEGISLEVLEVTVSDPPESYQQEDEKSKRLYYDTRMETAAGEITFSNRVNINREEDRYLLEWKSSLIFPQLEETDRVVVYQEDGERGSIYDRNAELLAGNGFVISVGLVPGKMKEEPGEELQKLSELLEITMDFIESRLEAEWVTEDTFVPLKSIPASLNALQEELLELEGVMLTEENARVYPQGKAAAHLTGYIQSISQEELEELEDEGYTSESKIGRAGVESLYEERLRSQSGIRISIIDKNGEKKDTLARIMPRNGEDIYLTIDARIQEKLYSQLAEDKSTSVVMNPYTGEVLALSSTPGYDPNDFILGMTEKLWEELSEDERQPMYNRFRATVVPGSSIKPVIAAAALHAGSVKAEDNLGYSGLSWQKDTSWGGYYITTLVDYGSEATMENALVYSDNIYFAKVALQMGADALAEQLLNLGFGETLPFDFGLAESAFGGKEAIEAELLLADTGYGQGYLQVNPVHMASIYSAFVNDGDMILPYLEYEEEMEPKNWKTGVFTSEEAASIRDMMIQVVENPQGTGSEMKIEGMKIGGKTGTAEKKENQEDQMGTELGWFCAFNMDSDSEKPYMAITMVEDVKERGGSHYVIPVVRSLFIDEER